MSSSPCWSRSSRAASTRRPTATGPAAEPTTRSPRSSTTRRPPRITSGSWRPTSRRASIASTTPRSSAPSGRSPSSHRLQERPHEFQDALVSDTRSDLAHQLTGTPQGGIISPLLANIALPAPHRPYWADWQEMSRYTGRRQYVRSRGHAIYRLVRSPDDLVIMVTGCPLAAQALLEQFARPRPRDRLEAEGREDRRPPT
jgi:hypothetical protein